MKKKIIVAFLSATLAASSAFSADLANCIARFRNDVGRDFPVTLETYNTYVSQATDYTEEIAQKSAAQPEFRQAIWDYLALAVDAERIEDGKTVLKNQRDALTKIAQRYSVDPETVVAFFGVETNYGKVMGKYPVIDATLSRACLRPENEERRKQLFAALWLVQAGHVRADDFKGSWAGAFGMTQFMPATFVDNMADIDEDGHSDIIHSTADALGTTARFVQKLRWQTDLPWAVEVRLPEGFNAQQAVSEKEHACLNSHTATGGCKSLSAWQAQGVQAVSGQALSTLTTRWPQLTERTPMALIYPAPQGPAWLVTRNFQAMWGYNRSDSYAMAIGLLSDALRGNGLNKTPWPVSDLGLSRQEIRSLQGLLQNRGYCDVTPDGIAGPATQNAIRAEERRLGWTETGRPGQKVLTALSRAAADSGVASPALGCGLNRNEATATKAP